MFLNFFFWFADLVKTTRVFLERSFHLRINNSYRAICFVQVLKTLGWTIVKEIGKFCLQCVSGLNVPKNLLSPCFDSFFWTRSYHCPIFQNQHGRVVHVFSRRKAFECCSQFQEFSDSDLSWTLHPLLSHNWWWSSDVIIENSERINMTYWHF